MAACRVTQAGFETVLLETRHVKAALSAMSVKTDRKDACGLGQRPAHEGYPERAGDRDRTAGSPVVRVGLREWPMPVVRGKERGIKERMVCPRCDASRDDLYWVDGEWGCRGCFDLGYACRHQQRYCPAIARRARLLRKLARVSPRGLRARRLRVQIAHQQAAMLASVKRANRDLSKRSRRHAQHGRANPE
jgi:hypothetical protein